MNPVSEFCDRWGFDQVSLPRYGQQIHDALPVSHLIEVQEAAHEPLESLSLPGPCGQNIVTDFLEDPENAPDATCVDDFALQLGDPRPPRLR